MSGVTASCDDNGEAIRQIRKLRMGAAQAVSVQLVGEDRLALCEEGFGLAAGGRGEELGEVLVQAAALEATGGVR